MNLYLLNTPKVKQRRAYAKQWAELRHARWLLRRAGHYYAASILAAQLRTTARCWRGLCLLVVLACSCGAAEVRTSWYGAECAGKKMANGQPFKPGALTCASWDYALGTKLRVTRGDRSVVVTVTDRGPAKRLLDTRRLDLSEGAFSKLAPTSAGILKVHVEAVPVKR